MKFMTIWTLPAAPLREKVSRTHDWAWRTAAAHLPKRLAYWSYIHQSVRNTEPTEIVPEVPYMTVLSRMDTGSSV
jgi:hypothetical protein